MPFQHHSSVPKLQQVWMNINMEREAPWIYTRIASFATVAALLGRRVWLPYGSRLLYPNLYVVLAGEPASKKSTIINQSTDFARVAGFRNLSPKHLNRTKLLKDLQSMSHAKDFAAIRRQRDATIKGMAKLKGIDPERVYRDVGETGARDVTAEELEAADVSDDDNFALGGVDDGRDNEMFLSMPEMTDNTKSGSVELWTTVNNLWDNHGTYSDASGIVIPKPCINLLGAVNPSSFNKVFPPTEMQSGLITRIILVRGHKTDRFLLPMDFRDTYEEEVQVIKMLRNMMDVEGAIKVDADALNLVRDIGKHQPRIADTRFSYYYDRRLEQLFKLCMIAAVMHGRMTVTSADVLYCNTVLTYNEWHMADALGDYGISSTMRAADQILMALRNTHDKAMTRPQLNRAVHHQMPNTLVYSEALTYLKDTGAVTMAAGKVYLNTKQLDELDKFDGRLYDSSLLPEWLEQVNKM